MSITISELHQRVVRRLNEVSPEELAAIEASMKAMTREMIRMADASIFTSGESVNEHPWETSLEALERMLRGEIRLPHLGEGGSGCGPCVLASQRRRRSQILAGQSHGEHDCSSDYEHCIHCQWQLSVLEREIEATQARIEHGRRERELSIAGWRS